MMQLFKTSKSTNILRGEKKGAGISRNHPRTMRHKCPVLKEGLKMPSLASPFGGGIRQRRQFKTLF